MSAYPKRFYTLNEYFAVERVGDARYEYWNGDILCMSGGSKSHAQIAANVYGELYGMLKGKRCRAFTSESPIKTPTLPPYRYPDASVVCDEPIFEKIGGIDVLTNPTIVIEVLSQHTESVDRKEKFEAYKALESMREYVLFAQNAPVATHYERQANGEWERFEAQGLYENLRLTAIGCALALRDAYANVAFE